MERGIDHPPPEQTIASAPEHFFPYEKQDRFLFTCTHRPSFHLRFASANRKKTCQSKGV